MAAQQIAVWLDNAGSAPQPLHVGTLTCPAHRSTPAAFAYDAAWLAHPQAFALEPQLPLVAGPQYPAQGTLHAIFRDSAPDRWGRVLIERREALDAARERRTVRNLFDLDFLLAVQDSSRMGALRFQSGDGIYLSASEFAVPPVSKLRELQALAQRIQQDGIEQLPEYEQWLAMLMAPGTSLGGARPKANFEDTDGTLWIAKFPAKDDRYDVAAWEYLAHQLAGNAGIAVPNARLEDLGGGYRSFCVQRFDRSGSLNEPRRMYASAMSLTGKQDGEPASYLDIAQVLTDQGARGHIDADLAQLFRRLLFNISIANRDDHLRNHGFLWQGDGWRLAPAFDMNPNTAKREHALDVGGAYADTEGALNAAYATHDFYRLSAAQANTILEEVLAAASQWQTVAQRCAISQAEMRRMASAFGLFE
ncbi:type II toxin-antitoxin system HipA family toxin [Comamonas testosteroni]|uniref:Type II toxin-antitoxin system HipA family toxin n=1 Tax=Comamonas testosteroni TaxID=285 RepID=A0A373FSE0_COMTE|nr:type II toxin-antitoxin system HipA family toxin [Comamonas testosteroni]RGE47081.1 type II toxin-antitoxin system HipA family toxin [Comamonas testosteroni]